MYLAPICVSVVAPQTVDYNELTVSIPTTTSATFSDLQGQYLAFIHAYTKINGRPPAQADLQRHFEVSPPSVHQMVLTLERLGLIRRIPGQARSLEVLVAPEDLPPLK